MSGRIERIAAWAIALAVNAFVITCLSTAMRPIGMQSAKSQEAIQVVFVPLPKKENNVRQTAAPAHRHASFAIGKITSTKWIPPANASPTAQQVDLSISSDDWTQPATPSLGSVEHDTFKPDPFHRRAPPMEATVDRMLLTFHDTSLGGRLKEMSRRSACRELKAALSSHPASTNAILASMKKYGCDKH